MGSAEADTTGEYEYENENEEEMEGEESRELSHEEIWDDSALVNAWEAAMEEYEAYHGPDKGWKKDPVKKSPLWYNIPPASTSKSASKATPSTSAVPAPATTTDANEADSQPINFDTFVPSHDPSLDHADAQIAAMAPMADYAGGGVGAMVGQDEAFERALSAMYWGGYWTAMYHCQRQLSQPKPPNTVDSTDDIQADAETEEEEDADEGDPEDEFVSTQR